MSQKKLPIQRTFDFSALRLAFTAVLGITLGMVQSAVSEPLILSGHTDQVAAVAVSPDGTRILSGGWDDTGRIWDAASGALLHTFALHEDWITSVAFSPDGSRIALGSWDQSLSVWNAVGGDPVLHAPSPRGFVLDVVFAPSGEALWTSLGRRYGTQLRDIATGTELAKLSTTNRDGTWCVALSPDGSQVAVGGSDKRIYIWSEPYAEYTQALSSHDENICSLDFSPSDSSVLVAGSWDGVAIVWDIEAGTQIRTLAGHTRAVTGVAYSPDGNLIATASLDGTIILWDAASGEVSRTVKAVAGSVRAVEFTPDGSRLVSGHGDGTVRVFDLAE